MKSLIELMSRRQPHLVVIGGEDLDALRLVIDVQMCIADALQQGDLNAPMQIPVEIANSDAARVYMNSRMAMVSEFHIIVLIFN